MKPLLVFGIQPQALGFATMPTIWSSSTSADKSAPKQRRGGSYSSLAALEDLLLGFHATLGLSLLGKAHTGLCNGCLRVLRNFAAVALWQRASGRGSYLLPGLNIHQIV